MSERQIGQPYAYYGSLWVKEEDGKYYWSIENWDGHDWFEISKKLFDELNKHQDELEEQS